MENQNQSPKNYRSYLPGLFLFFGMTSYYFLIKYQFVNIRNELEGAVFVNLILAALYFLFIILRPAFKFKGRFWKVDEGHFSISIAMLCISAYTVNLVIPMFNTFPVWTEVMLFTILLPLVSNGFRSLFPEVIKVAMAFISGVGMLFSLYFAIYLVPATGIGIIGTIIFGLGVHVFAPAILLSKFVRDLLKIYQRKVEKLALIAGVSIPLILVVFYLIRWQEVRKELHAAHAEVMTNPNQELPKWVLLSQNLADDYFTETLIKTGIYYAEPRRSNDMWFDLPTNNGVEKMHDPLVFLANVIYGEIPFSQEDKLSILNAQYAARHDFQPKLWSDENLKTVEIINQINIHPGFRYAYTEKTINIKNTNPYSWPSQEEAHYTFHVPEGSIMSSLSLWVNGEERKSRLTTKQKATEAYGKIVGVQRRDPAIAHWQEGNRITVSVFPCSKDEDRIFKIGITTPLTLNGDQLIYENFYFEGPPFENTLETTKLKVIDPKNGNIHVPSGFELSGLNQYSYTGKCIPQFQVSCPVQAVESTPFCFNGNCYEMKEQSKEISKEQFENIYIDINQTLSEEEFEAIWKACEKKKVYAFWNEMVLLTAENKNLVYEHLSQQNFSLFPLHHIQTMQNLIITKSTNLGPNLSDLKQSRFKEKMEKYLGENRNPIKVVSLNQLSDYWSSLNQFQVIDVHYETVEKLQSIINGDFPSKSDSDKIVYIDNAKVQITKVEGNSKTSAPDHLLRIFNFNVLMKQIGNTFYNSEQYEDALFPLANEAFILTPISSMIVLETDEDYKNNQIDENQNSLDNASISSSGSVPEPHEWALIILAVGGLLWLYRKRVGISFKV